LYKIFSNSSFLGPEKYLNEKEFRKSCTRNKHTKICPNWSGLQQVFFTIGFSQTTIHNNWIMYSTYEHHFLNTYKSAENQNFLTYSHTRQRGYIQRIVFSRLIQLN